MNLLIGLGIGLVVLGFIIMTGLIVLQEFENTSGDIQVTNTSDFIQEELGNEGIVGWIPAVVAISIGVIFIGLFLGRKFLGRSV